MGESQIQWEQPQIWSRMARNSTVQYKDLPETVVQKRDSQQIIDLIEQLERDLKTTRKNATKER